MMDTATAARAVSGRIVGDSVRFARVTTDSRALQAGDLFVALSGERFDGHDFVATAFERGAVAALVSADHADRLAGNLVVAADPQAALGALAAHWRRQFTIPVIVIVGSNGKTTVKEMLASILRAHFGDAAVLATQGNLNNAIGLPLTLLRLRAAHRVAAIELGMNHRGETATLAAIAQPTVALVNNAQREHQEFMSTVAEVAAEHADLVRALPEHGIAVLNADDAHVDAWRGAARERKDVGVIEFGLERPAAVRGRHAPRPEGCGLEITTATGDINVVLAARGRHSACNALAAATAALAVGVPLAAVAQGLQSFRPVAGRLAALPRHERRGDHRRHVQRQSGFGARGDRRAGGRAGAALAGAGRHGRSRRRRAEIPSRGRRVRALGAHRAAADGGHARGRGRRGVRRWRNAFRFGRGARARRRAHRAGGLDAPRQGLALHADGACRQRARRRYAAPDACCACLPQGGRRPRGGPSDDEGAH